MTDVRRIALVGDLHGELHAARSAIARARRDRVDLVLQLGDFGFWPGPRGPSFAQVVDGLLGGSGLEMWFIDGNHEHHDALLTLPIDDTGRRLVGTHLWHLPRGHRWQMGGLTWVAIGGAASVDGHLRLPGLDWFPEAEVIQDEECVAILAAPPADVVLSHDAPFGVPTLFTAYQQDRPAEARTSSWPTAALIASDAHQRRLATLVERLRPRVLVHGHHHHRYDDRWSHEHGVTRVHGLGCDPGAGDDYLLIDLSTDWI